ncbi:MAG: HlyC/CorC family transporter [Candidatus Diapherotrites archaeon]|uniref:HlyC/CorC family transporter n=1 Tax=Candidatus Iainarchaeum sp. TaxID=3101447 RepID=A0A8T3YNI3_9ARCH|nr:HlyC/CorC family transporter [Candidatus Diapherotrites archaeon]
MLDTSLWLDFLVLAALLLLSAFFASVETAFLSISRARMRKLADSKAPNAKLLLELKSRPHSTLVTILVANNLVNVTAASVATALALQFVPGNFGIAISAGIVTFTLLVFGEITPKSIALKHNAVIALRSAPILNFLRVALAPVVFILVQISGFLARLVVHESEEQKLTEEEIKALVSIGAEEGAILDEEKDMIHKVFQLNDIEVSQVMTPRNRIIALKSGLLVKDLEVGELKEHARFPVYRNGLDDIIGVFYVRDYLGVAGGSGGRVPVDSIMRSPLFVHGQRRINSVLRKMQEKKVQMAIVVDNKGKTTGLVTLEDVLAEIVGEIGEMA